MIEIAGIGGYGWTRLVLAGATVVWSLTWIGMLLARSSITNAGRGVGWWILLLSVAVAVIGAITAWISDRRVEAPAQHVDSVTEG